MNFLIIIQIIMAVVKGMPDIIKLVMSIIELIRQIRNRDDKKAFAGELFTSVKKHDRNALLGLRDRLRRRLDSLV